MKPFRLFLSVLALMVWSLAAVAQQAPVETRMSAAEFKAAGLDKLSPDELRHLNAWLAAQSAEVASIAPAATPAPRARAITQRRTADLNKSRIQGTVQAWDVGTVFTLDNGEKWEVVAGKARLYRPLQHPEVTLVPSLMGAWFLKFNADSDVAKPKVERVE